MSESTEAATTIIGIDPGASGGVAVLERGARPFAAPMPATARDLYDLILVSQDDFEDFEVFVEKVGAGPKMGSSAAFKFGHSAGMIAGLCTALQLRTHYVAPGKWQRHFGLIVRGRGLGQRDTDKKNRNKARAQELFPRLRVTHATADALLIAEYGRRFVNGGG